MSSCSRMTEHVLTWLQAARAQAAGLETSAQDELAAAEEAYMLLGDAHYSVSTGVHHICDAFLRMSKPHVSALLIIIWHQKHLCTVDHHTASAILLHC